MAIDDVAAAVLECVGGIDNVVSSSLCATRLRISLRNAKAIDRNALNSINGVLGIASRGANGIEVVFGPNLVRSVFGAFRSLTGPQDRHSDEARQTERPSGNFQVRITPETPGMPGVTGVVARPQVDVVPVEDDDTNALLEMLDSQSEKLEQELPELDELVEAGERLLVVNGPNINMLGIREPDLYGKADYQALLVLCKKSASEAGFADCACYQSNHEGDLIDCIQDAYGCYDAIVINPGGYTHTSIALLDALKAVDIPTIEVHISQVAEREEFRQVSYVRQACLETIMGLGIEGYRKAIFDLADHLGIS